ncbi:MAG: hypothetical protein AAF750_11470 [Planctomycetota bacterium]
MSTPVTSYRLQVISPCPGTAIVVYFGPQFYAGNAGDFTAAQLSLVPGQARWGVVIFDYANPSGPCFPTRTFVQLTPNTSDPEGGYVGLDSSGNPDPSEGSINVIAL